jgi:ankyrin repeat protein
MTALMLAVESKDLDKAKLLIQHGADPELADDFNATSLRHAVEADFADGGHRERHREQTPYFAV